MARRPFGGTADLVVINPITGLPIPYAPGTAWDARVGGVQVTDLTDADGVSLDGGTITANEYGQVEPFQGPVDGTSELWLDFGVGDRALVQATDPDERLDALEASVGQAGGLVPLGPGGTIDPQYLPPPLEWINAVDEHGAVGDDSTDDHAAITAALAAAPEGGVVYLPPGWYRTSAPIRLARNVTLVMGGGPAPRWPYKSGLPAYIRATADFAGDGVIELLDMELSGEAVELYGPRLVNVGIHGNQLNIWGIYSRGRAQDVTLTGVTVLYAEAGGVHTESYTRVGGDLTTGGAAGWRMDQVTVCYGDGDGFDLNGFTDGNLSGCLAVSVGGHGYHLTGPSDVHIVDSRAVFNHGSGFLVDGTNGSTQLIGCSTDRNDLHGIHLNAGNSRHPIVVNGCYARRDGADGGYAGLRIQGTSAGTPHCPVTVNGLGVHVARGDANDGNTSPTYGVQITDANPGLVSLSGVIAAGNTAGLLDAAGAAVIAPGCRFGTTDNAFATTWDVGSVYDRVPLYARKTANSVLNNTAALFDDPDLRVTVVANAVYDVDGILIYDSSINADFKIQFAAPSGSTYNWAPFSLGTAAGSTTASVNVGPVGLGSLAIGALGVGTPATVPFKGTLVVGSTGGTFLVAWAQNTAEATNTTMRAHSRMTLVRRA